MGLADNCEDKPAESFAAMALKDGVLRGLSDCGLLTPSLLQRRLVGRIAAMRDVLVCAPNGSGKTAAYSIGLLQNIDADQPCCQALVLVPSRERAANVNIFIQRLGVPAFPHGSNLAKHS